jgi:hypothetical protein
VAFTDCNDQNHRFTKPGRICGRLFFYFVCDHVSWLAPSSIAASGERVALRKTAELHGTRIHLTQVFLSPKSAMPRWEKQNGEGSRLPLYKTAQLKICLLTLRAQKGSRDLYHSIAQRVEECFVLIVESIAHSATCFFGESCDCVNLIARSFYVG